MATTQTTRTAQGDAQTDRRRAGRAIRRQLRRVAQLDAAWRQGGRREGRTENDLAFELGRAYRAGIGTKARRVQARNAKRLGL